MTVGLFGRRPRDPTRHKVDKYQGWCEPVDGSPYPRVHGKIEWDAFASGDSEIEVMVQLPDVPDGEIVDLVWGDRVIMSMTARRGLISRDLETKDGDDVPRIADQQVELHCRGAVIARAFVAPQ